MGSTYETKLSVDGMTCGSCVRHIESALGALEGVRGVDVRMQEGKVFVQHDPERAPLAKLIEALNDAGYEGRQSA